MSLLMDALRRAEQAKRQAEGVANATPAASEASSVAQQAEPPAEKAPPPPVDVTSGLTLLDDELSLPCPPAAPPGDERTREQEAVDNLFATKEVVSRRPFYLVVGVLTALAVAAIGVYFWLQLRPSTLVTTPVALAPRPLAAPQAPPDRPPAAIPAEPTQNIPVAATHSADSRAALVPAVRKALTPAHPPQARDAVAARPPENATAAREEKEPEDDGPIRVSSARLTVNPLLSQAYEAFQSGDMIAARQHYEQVTRAEPKNVNALLGLAAIALSDDRPEQAEVYYLRAAEADPTNAAAQAGLLNLRPSADPVRAESRIKTLLAGQPDSPALLFALGNVYAQQNRWHEAQQAYFQAHTGDSENPDYLYNLAVSLDQLRQPQLALRYYQGALAAAERRPAGFDRDAAARRMRDLQP